MHSARIPNAQSVDRGLFPFCPRCLEFMLGARLLKLDWGTPGPTTFSKYLINRKTIMAIILFSQCSISLTVAHVEPETEQPTWLSCGS